MSETYDETRKVLRSLEELLSETGRKRTHDTRWYEETDTTTMVKKFRRGVGHNPNHGRLNRHVGWIVDAVSNLIQEREE